MAKVTMKQLAELLEQVQAQLTALSERVQQLEGAVIQPPPAETPAPPAVQEKAPPPEPAPVGAPA